MIPALSVAGITILCDGLPDMNLPVTAVIKTFMLFFMTSSLNQEKPCRIWQQVLCM